MNKIMTIMKSVQSKSINNLLGGENREYAIFSRAMRAGVLPLAVNVAGAYAIYNNVESVIGRNTLGDYTIETPYAFKAVNIGAGIISYGLMHSLGVPVCYAIIKLAQMLHSITKEILKMTCITIPSFFINFGKLIAQDLINNIKDFVKLAFEWRKTTILFAISALFMYITPDLAWESVVWCHENYEILMKSFDVTDKSKFMIKATLALVGFLIQNSWEHIKDFINNSMSLIAIIIKRELHHMLFAITFGLLFLKALELDIASLIH